MRKLKALFHPIFIFIGVQFAWIVLMAVWINWHLKIKEINCLTSTKSGPFEITADSGLSGLESV